MSDELEKLTAELASKVDWSSATVAKRMAAAVSKHCDSIELPKRERAPTPTRDDVSEEAFCKCGWPKRSHKLGFGCGANWQNPERQKDEPGL